MSAYARGAIVVCHQCGRPIYVLERGIAQGEKLGRAASAFRPLTRSDCHALLQRTDLDAGWLRAFQMWLLTDDVYAVFGASRPRTGEIALCPRCGEAFPWIDDERRNAHDRAYEWFLDTIEPTPSPRRVYRYPWRVDGDDPDLKVDERNATH